MALAAFAPGGVRAAGPGELGLRLTYSVSSDALTTEKVWALDADEPNPHRQRWVLNRKVELRELLPPRAACGAAWFSVNGGKSESGFLFGVTAAGLDTPSRRLAISAQTGREATARSASFPAKASRPSWYATAAGSRLAAERAAKEWERLLELERIPLSNALKHLTAPTPGAAIEKAKLLFDGWLTRVDAAWRSAGRAAARKAEWNTYLLLAKDQGLCAGPARARGGSEPRPTVKLGRRVRCAPPPGPPAGALGADDGVSSPAVATQVVRGPARTRLAFACARAGKALGRIAFGAPQSHRGRA